MACKTGRRKPEVAQLLVVGDDCIRGKCVADYWIIKGKWYPMATDDTNTVMSDSGGIALYCRTGNEGMNMGSNWLMFSEADAAP